MSLPSSYSHPSYFISNHKISQIRETPRHSLLGPLDDLTRPQTLDEVARPETLDDLARPETLDDVARPETLDDLTRPET